MIWQLSGPITYAKALQGLFLFVGILTLLTGSEIFLPVLAGEDRGKTLDICPCACTMGIIQHSLGKSVLS